MDNQTIFVEIAAYRDMELRDTVAFALANAARPENLRFGIVQQCGEEDRDILREFWHDGRFKILQMDWRNCRGVGRARALTETLYGGEDYVLQIDAHMVFGEGWDEKFKEQWRRCGDGKAVLSTYPAIYHREEDGRIALEGATGPVQRIEMTAVDDSTALKGVVVSEERPGMMKRALYVSGGMEFFPGEVFDKMHYVQEVAFTGEELVRSAQFYTYGYNIYVPVGVPVYHHYGRKGAHRYWSDMLESEEAGLKETYQQMMLESGRVKQAILRGEDERYFGRERSLQAFLELVGRWGVSYA